jgi:hypothetical protein
LKKFPSYYIYNGYDFFKQGAVQFLSSKPNNVLVNLGASVSTRELEVIHKAKLTKAARIKKAASSGKIKKTSPSAKNRSSAQKRYVTLSKKFKK